MSGSNHNRLRVDCNRNRDDGLVDYLRRRHPEKTAISVAADTGLPPGSIAKWLSRETQPSLSALRALVAVYGAELLAVALFGECPAWLDEAIRAQRRAAYDAQIETLRAARDRL